jgi:hypothetical protein
MPAGQRISGKGSEEIVTGGWQIEAGYWKLAAGNWLFVSNFQLVFRVTDFLHGQVATNGPPGQNRNQGNFIQTMATGNYQQ